MSEETIKMLNIINDKVKEYMKGNNVNDDTLFSIPLGAYGDFGYLTNKMLNEIIQTQQELTKYKERNEKAIEYIETHKRKDGFLELNEWKTRDLLEILEDKEI